MRPQYNHAQLIEQIERQQSNGYQLVAAIANQQVLAVAGFNVGEKLAWGKHIYVDDLVTNPDCRSQGLGKALVDWLKQHAKELGCQQIHLDSGVQRFKAHRFYLREQFNIASHHFSITKL